MMEQDIQLFHSGLNESHQFKSNSKKVSKKDTINFIRIYYIDLNIIMPIITIIMLVCKYFVIELIVILSVLGLKFVR